MLDTHTLTTMFLRQHAFLRCRRHSSFPIQRSSACQKKKKKRHCFFFPLAQQCPFYSLAALDYEFRGALQSHLGHAYGEYTTRRHIMKEGSHPSPQNMRNSISGSRLSLYNFKLTVQKLILSSFPLYPQVKDISSISAYESKEDSFGSIGGLSGRKA